MTAPRASVLAVHVDTARQLLAQLEQHATAAIDALAREDHAEFQAAVASRDGVMAQLDLVIADLTRAWEADAAANGQASAEALEMLSEFAEGALTSHQRLVQEAEKGRDRLAAAMERMERPDQVANQYAAATAQPRSVLSVTG